MTRHKRSHGHPLHPGLAPDVLTLSCLWIQLGQDERVRLNLRALHYNPIHSTCHLNQQHTFTVSTYMQIIQKPCGDARAAKQKVRKHWKL